MEYLEWRLIQMWKNLLVKSSTRNCWRIVESEDSNNQKQKLEQVVYCGWALTALLPTVDGRRSTKRTVAMTLFVVQHGSSWNYTSEISLTHHKIYDFLTWNCSELCLTGFWLSLLHPLYLPLLKSMGNPSAHKLLTLKEHCTLVAGIPRTFHLAFILSLWEFK